MGTSLFELLLAKRFRLPRWMRIAKWRGVRNARMQKIDSAFVDHAVDFIDYFYCKGPVPRTLQWRRKLLYERTLAGPFFPFRDCNLLATAHITGECEQDAWLRVPWDVWKLIFHHIPFVAEQMEPVCTYFWRRLKTYKGNANGDRCTDYVRYRTRAFEDYQPRVCRKSRVRNGPHFCTRNSRKAVVATSGFELYSSAYPSLWVWVHPNVRFYFTSLDAKCSKQYVRHNSPIVASKRFQQFEWKPRKKR